MLSAMQAHAPTNYAKEIHGACSFVILALARCVDWGTGEWSEVAARVMGTLGMVGDDSCGCVVGIVGWLGWRAVTWEVYCDGGGAVGRCVGGCNMLDGVVGENKVWFKCRGVINHAPRGRLQAFSVTCTSRYTILG